MLTGSLLMCVINLINSQRHRDTQLKTLSQAKPKLINECSNFDNFYGANNKKE